MCVLTCVVWGNMTVLSATENRLYSSERVAEPGAGRGSPRTDDAAHLVILQNGLWGSPEDMSFTGKTLSEKFGSSAKIVYSTVNGVCSAGCDGWRQAAVR